MTSIEQVVQAYHNLGFRVCALLGDGQFKHIQKLIEDKGISINLSTADEHVPVIERSIRTV